MIQMIRLTREIRFTKLGPTAPWACRLLLLVFLLAVLGLGVHVLGVAMAERAVTPGAPADQRIWQDERIYFIMIDRFSDGDPTNNFNVMKGNPYAWHGGDLQGIIDKLDYIKSLGFTAIWITPHVRNAGIDYHGYAAVDFYEVDPHFGTKETLKRLVSEAHARGLKVIFDIVVNHTGPNNPLVVEKPEWFHPRREISNWNDTEEVRRGWLFGLPDFDQSNPEVREYILEYSRFWIEETDVDGFRLDTVKHVEPEFWSWYVPELQKIKPGFWVIGEVWDSSPYRLAEYQRAGVTALIDFPESEAARQAFARDGSLAVLAQVSRQVEMAMEDPWQMGAFLDNHDMPRFTTYTRDDPIGRLKLGLIWLFTQRAIPIVYYGTEIGMEGGNDPYNRADFPWGEEENLDVRDLVVRLNDIRSRHIALRRGGMEMILADWWRYAYARTLGEDRVVVVLNNHPSQPFVREIELSALNLPDGTVLVDELTGGRVQVQNGRISVDIRPRSGAIYVVQPNRSKSPGREADGQKK
ncbi:MAG: alpha-amylase [Limnochordales bacterium]|nr:alpha-amylase [Limnochordales bacterium]